ncbi:MAG: 50S ribosomal protein L23 [Candidatus Anammoxibacter sp.]
MDECQIIKKPIHSEKSVSDRKVINTYYFEVDFKANKIQIKNAIEKLFSVKVKSVRTMIRKGKKRRTKNILGMTKSKKRAIVTLNKDEVIDLGY